MSQFEQLDELLEKHEGMLQTAKVVEAGFTKQVFYAYVKAWDLERVAHGICV